MLNKFRRINFKNEYFFFLLPLFFILHRYVEHLEAIKATEAIFLYFRYVLWMIVVFLIGYFLFKDSRKAILFAFVLSAFNFFYGSAHDWLKEVFPGSFFIQYKYILPFSLILFIIIFIWIKKTSRNFSVLTRYLNILFIVLIAIEFVQLAIKKNHLIPSLPAEIKNCDSCTKPDIYFIIADGYGGRRQLLQDFKFDNSEFENYLSAKGFYIADSSISNYSATVLSISSMFNMDYVKSINGKESHEITNQTGLFKFLKNSGYSISNYSFFKIDGQQPFVASRHFPAGIKLITSHSFLSRIESDIRHNLATKLKISSEINRINRFIEAEKRKDLMKDSLVMQGVLKEAARKNTQPKFVYGHFTAPHPPFLFDKNGNPLPARTGDPSYYTGYLQWINTKIQKLIDQILITSSKPPVIIFMSDHGFRKEGSDKENHSRFLNINAVYLPDKNYSGYYKGMSNVNQFRMLLNKEFGQKLPLLKDSVVYLREEIQK